MPRINIVPAVVTRAPSLVYTVDKAELNLVNYRLMSDSATMYYGLFEQGTGQLVSEGNITLNEEQIANWGTDDTTLITTTLSLLGLQLQPQTQIAPVQPEPGQ